MSEKEIQKLQKEVSIVIRDIEGLQTKDDRRSTIIRMWQSLEEEKIAPTRADKEAIKNFLNGKITQTIYVEKMLENPKILEFYRRLESKSKQD